MYSLNRVQLMGNLTVTPENKSTANSNYCDFSIAINKKYKNSNGEMVESVQFANCKCWGKGADILSKYAKKGQEVYVEGELETSKYQDKDGNNRSVTRVIVKDFKLFKKSDSSENSNENTNTQSQENVEQQNVYQNNDEDDIDIEDIPF